MSPKRKFKKEESVKIEITKLAFKGFGFGKVEEVVFFVPFGVPGDKLLVKIYDARKSYNFAKIVKIIEPSPYRVEVECPYFMKCGGCSHLNMNYISQLKYKKILLEEIMREFPVKIDDFIESQPFNYRNKLMITLEYRNGKLLNGLYAKGSHELINIDNCLLQSEIINSAKNRIIEELEKSFHAKELKLFRNLLIRINKSGELLICFILKNKIEMKEFAKKIYEEIENITSIYNFLNNSNGNNLFDRSDKNSYHKSPLKHLYGNKSLIETVKNNSFHIFPETFFQVNISQLDNMIDLVLQSGGKGINLIDMYSGIGFFGLSFRERFKKIYFIEKSNNSSFTISNDKEFEKKLFFYEEDISIAIKKILKSGIMSDLLIIDPPRAGINEDVIIAIERLIPSKIIMISCNPTTLARDLKKITKLKYNVSKIVPLDNFPQTFHIECIVLLEKNM